MLGSAENFFTGKIKPHWATKNTKNLRGREFWEIFFFFFLGGGDPFCKKISPPKNIIALNFSNLEIKKRHSVKNPNGGRVVAGNPKIWGTTPPPPQAS